MKIIISKYKEIIVSGIIILAVLTMIGINFYHEYKKEININDSKDISTSDKNQFEKNSYYIENNKLYISYDGENIIEVPGDFSEMQKYEDETYQISEIKTVFYYILENKEYLVYSDDCGKNWNTIERERDGTIKYIEFISKDTGYRYEIKDVAMTIAYGVISKTIDGGKTWQDIYSGIDGVFKTDSKVKFFDNYIGFITMPNNGGDTCELYVTQDGGITFDKVQVEYMELEDTELKWTDIYDYYNIPIKQNGCYYLEISQGADGDYKGGKSLEYYSYNGLSWTTEEIEKNNREKFDNEFDARVESRSDKIFLKNFENYNPSSSEIKIPQSEAEKIADIGFEEAGTIGEIGEKESQTFRIEEVIANNFFTMDHDCISKQYNNVRRRCYVFIRENEMGCGAMVYVDVTTGLIIGGQCFGD